MYRLIAKCIAAAIGGYRRPTEPAGGTRDGKNGKKGRRDQDPRVSLFKFFTVQRVKIFSGKLVLCGFPDISRPPDSNGENRHEQEENRDADRRALRNPESKISRLSTAMACA
ncbi:hypothetical protein [Burkholderia pseudomallei]|uniref:hypothetical protein n=1 Tax=Burkholderia pseudomallei TaxID=28450 RepID=UPI0009765219|nr:hypothetical protein [Burkholderia pseudomallei]